ncbi:hypothetical protein AMECASPLE_020785 [Ameca splendens]|uniref:Uncharacterized protein n=1 Tax=Ameca splendens TaxID=208324 RepID=A0ABV0Y3D0_9TELE
MANGVRKQGSGGGLWKEIPQRGFIFQEGFQLEWTRWRLEIVFVIKQSVWRVGRQMTAGDGGAVVDGYGLISATGSRAFQQRSSVEERSHTHKLTHKYHDTYEIKKIYICY